MTQAMGWKRFEMPGRYAVTVQCADDLTDDEMIRMEAFFEAAVALLQKDRRGYTDAQASGWEAAILGMTAPPR